MDPVLMVVVGLGFAEAVVGIVLIVRAQPESLAGLPREEINRRVVVKKLGIGVMVSGILMAVGALMFWDWLWA